MSDTIPTEPGFLHKIGAAPLAGLRDVVGLWSLFMRTLYYCFRGRREKGAVAAQMFDIGNKSLFFMTVTMGFIGAIIAFQSGVQTKRLVPEMSMLGATFINDAPMETFRKPIRGMRMKAARSRPTAPPMVSTM